MSRCFSCHGRLLHPGKSESGGPYIVKSHMMEIVLPFRELPFRRARHVGIKQTQDSEKHVFDLPGFCMYAWGKLLAFAARCLYRQVEEFVCFSGSQNGPCSAEHQKQSYRVCVSFLSLLLYGRTCLRPAPAALSAVVLRVSHEAKHSP